MELINIRLSNGKEELISYYKVPCIINDDKISFIIDDIKTSISNKKFIRENKEYLFMIDIPNKLSTYKLKEKNCTFAIDVEKLVYKNDTNIIELVYKISSNEEELRMIIEREI